ncbi:MAG: GT2 family glycosyltransferase [Hyphomicrobiaceae bacterium]
MPQDHTPPRISALVIHYGDPSLTRRCLASLDGFDEIVVVDHPPTRLGSDTQTLPPGIRVIGPDRNLGFAGGCNAGIAEIENEFVFVINNDAELASGGIAKLRALITDLADDVAVVCPKVLSSDGAQLQSIAGMRFSADFIGVPRGFRRPDDNRYDSIVDCAAPSGAAFLVRARAWRDVGGMSQEFFCYCEDGDLGLRLIAAGHRITAAHNVVVRHALSEGSTVYSLQKAYLVERNRIWTAIHVAPAERLALLPLATAVRLFAMALDALRGRGAAAGMGQEATALALVSTLLRAWWDALRGLPAALSTRRRTLVDAAARNRVRNALAAHRATLSELIQPRK